MDKYAIAINLIRCFPNSFVNGRGEFVAHSKANEFFILDTCKTETDVKYKILAWFSRGAYKTEPYRTKKSNDQFHSFMLKGINKYLGTSFTENDMDLIYTRFGNGCNKTECYEFIRSGYDMMLLKGEEK